MCEQSRLASVTPWINDMMKNEGIKDYLIDVSGNTEKGDGYLGDITFVKITYNKDGHQQEYNVVIKAAKKSDHFRKQTPVKEAYDNEIFVYTKIWPVLQKFQEENHVEDPFNCIVRCFSVCSNDKNEAIILQNLKAIGYELWDRQIAMNVNHVRYTFQQYGKWHALSLALRHRKPEVFHDLTKDMLDVFGRFLGLGRMIPHIVGTFRNAMELLKEEGRLDIVEKFEKINFEDNIEHYLTSFTDPSDPCSVILHGDCWTNNFMFKYKNNDRSTPESMYLLDLQLARVASPVFDLSYFLYVNSDITVLKEFDSLLESYHSSLTDYLNKLGCDGQTLFPYQTLREHWRKYAKYGIALVPFVIRISLSDTNEAPDFAKAAEGNDGFSSVFNFKIRLEKEYARRVKDIHIQYAEAFL